MFQNVPEDELVDLAIDLDVPVPEEIDLEGMLSQVVQNLASLGEREGLPFSRYDKEDLEQLSDEERNAIARLNGVDPNASASAQIAGLLKTGGKIYKLYRKTKPKSQIPMYLPMLLGPLARHLVDGSS